MKGFFEQLSTVCEGLTLNMSISQKDGKMTVSLVPMVSNTKVHPVSVSNAEPKELDELFVNELINAVLLARPKVIGLKEQQESLSKKPKDQVTQNKVETKGTPQQKAAEVKKTEPEKPPKVEHQPGLNF